MDYDFRKRDFTKAITIAGAFPLFFQARTQVPLALCAGVHPPELSENREGC